MQDNNLYPRFLHSRLEHMLSWSSVVLISGPRQSGKTTFCKQFQAYNESVKNYEYFTFDDPSTVEFASEDPVRFVEQLPTYAILDEVQLVPSIFRLLKLSVDNNRIPGRLLLTGSADLSLMTELADAMVGRMNLLSLYPLSQNELRSKPTTKTQTQNTPPSSTYSQFPRVSSLFLENLFDQKMSNNSEVHIRMGPQLAKLVIAGGYPKPQGLDFSDRVVWFRDYIGITARRDIKALTSIRRVELIPQLIEVAAAYTSQLFNLSDLASSLTLSRNTISEYIALLRNLFILNYIPVWSKHRLKRSVKAPKLHFVDTGLACAFLDLDFESLWDDRKLFGRMVETFILQELIKQSSWLGGRFSFYHYRDRDKGEVDIVIEKSGQGVVAIEVKTRATVSTTDFRHLQKLRDQTDNFIAGVVLYDGQWTRSFGEKLFAIPISSLWEFTDN